MNTTNVSSNLVCVSQKVFLFSAEASDNVDKVEYEFIIHIPLIVFTAVC